MDETQEKTENFEQRHSDALAKIRAAFETVAKDDETQELRANLEQVRIVNATLSQELEALKAQRNRDVSELDTLIEQLKPLIGEA